MGAHARRPGSPDPAAFASRTPREPGEPQYDRLLTPRSRVLGPALPHCSCAALQVGKAFLFAAYDGCCEEQNSFYGVWRPAQLRAGPDGTQPYTQPRNLPQAMPLPAAAAYAAAAALVDVPSLRAPGVFTVDNSETRRDGRLYPSCVAFESLQEGVAPLLALFIIGHGLGDRVNATVTVPAAAAMNLTLVNGYGTPMPVLSSSNAVGSYTVQMSIAPLPQYLMLTPESGVAAASVCSTLVW
jgi:hypothetical protein